MSPSFVWYCSELLGAENAVACVTLWVRSQGQGTVGRRVQVYHQVSPVWGIGQAYCIYHRLFPIHSPKGKESLLTLVAH